MDGLWLPLGVLQAVTGCRARLASVQHECREAEATLARLQEEVQGVVERIRATQREVPQPPIAERFVLFSVFESWRALLLGVRGKLFFCKTSRSKLGAGTPRGGDRLKSSGVQLNPVLPKVTFRKQRIANC